MADGAIFKVIIKLEEKMGTLNVNLVKSRRGQVIKNISKESSYPLFSSPVAKLI